ncbi:cytochrome-b5 reductase [Acrasis kona]|uniref:cytochrome-b5 reductase n=1 Tax=Acrasis kona TaxID=1008807 RepID=A0AAW2ZME7_9EUKA
MFKLQPRTILRGAMILPMGYLGKTIYDNMQQRNSIYAEQKQALDSSKFVPLELASADKISHDTKKYVFKFEDKDQVSGLHVASCVLTMANIDGKNVVRPYTPVTHVDEKGHMDFVIKTYEKGNMSKHLDQLKPGDKLLIKGPIPKYPYKPNEKEHIGMIAGGTGIAPMYQIFSHALANPEDKTKFSLLYSNVSQEDILLRKEIDELAKKYPNRFKVHYSISKKDKVGTDWKYGVGYFDKKVIEEKAFKSEITPEGDQSKNLVLVCGPPRFMDAISGDSYFENGKKVQGPLKGVLKEMGFKEQDVFKF